MPLQDTARRSELHQSAFHFCGFDRPQSHQSTRPLRLSSSLVGVGFGGMLAKEFGTKEFPCS